MMIIFPLKKKSSSEKKKILYIETASEDFEGILSQFPHSHKLRIWIAWNVKSICWPKVVDM